MQRHRALIFFGVAFAIAVATSILVFSWLRNMESFAQPISAKTRLVAVASAELPWGTKLGSDHVKLVAYPDGGAPDGHFDKPESLEGRVLLSSLKYQEPILESKLAPVNAAGGVAGVIDPTKRAMGVRVDDVVGVAGFIKPGDRVDVMVTIEPNASGGRALSKVILENLKVLAAGTEMVRTGKDQEAKPVQVITLEVDIEEAEKLALASTQGKLRLALRNPLNTDEILTRGASVPVLLGSYRPKEAKPAESDEITRDQVEVIKGNVLTKGTQSSKARR
jgi:pilus assembly protein CpaB